MANSQLTAYASAQLDKGVSREAISQSLVGAGWMQADVDAALAEVMAQRPGVAAPAQPVQVAQPAVQPIQAAVQPVHPAAQTVQPVTQPIAAVTPAQSVTPASFFATTPAMTVGAPEIKHGHSLRWLFILVAILLALGIIGAAAYMLMGGTADVPLVQGPDANQLATVTQERDQLKAEVAKLSDDQQLFEAEVSLFQATTTPSLAVTIPGRLATTTAGAWTLTTAHNIVLTLSNSSAIGTSLAPFRDAEVTLTGTHAPGSTLLKVTAINGTALSAATTTPATAPASTSSVGTR